MSKVEVKLQISKAWCGVVSVEYTVYVFLVCIAVSIYDI